MNINWIPIENRYMKPGTLLLKKDKSILLVGHIQDQWTKGVVSQTLTYYDSESYDVTHYCEIPEIQKIIRSVV